MKKLFYDEEYSNRETINLLILIMLVSGMFGFIYETIFYRLDLGYFVKRGSTFGPWIPIYFFGGLFIILFTYHFKKKPWLVFLLSMLASGFIEYMTGYVLNHFFGLRLWDYNKEIWNFLNINGYICLRSVLFFGISSLLLIYGIIPILKKFLLNKKVIILAYILLLLFIIDCIAFAIVRYCL